MFTLLVVTGAVLLAGWLALRLLVGLVLLPFRLAAGVVMLALGLVRAVLGVVGALAGAVLSVVGVLLALVLLPLAPVLLVLAGLWLLARRRQPRAALRVA